MSKYISQEAFSMRLNRRMTVVWWKRCGLAKLKGPNKTGDSSGGFSYYVKGILSPEAKKNKILGKK